MDVALIEGELMKRVENTLFVGENMQMVSVIPETEIEIPSIQGANNVNQLKQHLEIQRMSKSKGNVVNPDELVSQYGADTVRAYLMFNFDWQKGGPWNENNIKGVIGWLNDVWQIVTENRPSGAGDEATNRDIERKSHQAVQAVETGFESFSFNRAVADQMKLKNFVKDALKSGTLGEAAYEQAVSVMLRLMAPVAPHIAEELWSRMGWEYSVHQQPWPEYDPEKAKEDEIALVVMINGKPRENIMVSPDISEEDAKATALAGEAAKGALNGKEPRRVIFIPGKGREPKVNIVV
jgi:leucyl-tRNA synthetase